MKPLKTCLIFLAAALVPALPATAASIDLFEYEFSVDGILTSGNAPCRSVT